MMRKLFRPWTEGIKGFARHLGQSFSTIMVVALTLLVVGALILVSMNLNHLSDNIEKSVEIYVEIDKTYEKNYLEYKKEVESMNLVSEVTYIDKEESMRDAIREINESYANYLGENNPYHDIFLVKVVNGASIEWVSKSLEDKEWTNTVYYGGEDTQNMMNTLNQVKSVATAFAGALVVVAIMLIVNTIKLSINHRSSEVRIMRTLGAKNSFIISPFIVEGLIIGGFGALIPILFLNAGYHRLVTGSESKIFSNILNFLPSSETSPVILSTLLGIGLLFGFIASLISVMTYLRKVR